MTTVSTKKETQPQAKPKKSWQSPLLIIMTDANGIRSGGVVSGRERVKFNAGNGISCPTTKTLPNGTHAVRYDNGSCDCTSPKTMNLKFNTSGTQTTHDLFGKAACS